MNRGRVKRNLLFDRGAFALICGEDGGGVSLVRGRKLKERVFVPRVRAQGVL